MHVQVIKDENSPVLYCAFPLNHIAHKWRAVCYLNLIRCAQQPKCGRAFHILQQYLLIFENVACFTRLLNRSKGVPIFPDDDCRNKFVYLSKACHQTTFEFTAASSHKFALLSY